MIGPLHLILLLFAGGFLAGTILHGVRVAMGTRRIEHLFLSAICFLAGLYLLIESHQIATYDTAQYLHWYRISRYATGTFMFIFPVFVAYATGGRGRIETVVFGGMAAVFMIHNTMVPSGPWLNSIDHISAFVMPWGERCATPVGSVSNWSYVVMAMWATVAIYCLSRDVLARGGGMLGPRALFWSNIFFLIAISHDFLILRGLLHGFLWAYFVAPVLTGGIWWQMSILERRRIDSFRDLFVGAGDAILVHDASSGEVVEANTSACTLFRAARSELIGMRLDDLISPTSPNKGTDTTRRIQELRTGGSLQRERILRRRDGSDFPAEIALRLATLEGRERFIASYRDLTDRMRVESALVENELRLRSVIARSPLAIVEAITDGSLVSLNPRFTELFGFGGKDPLTLERFAITDSGNPGDDATFTERWKGIFARSLLDSGVIPSVHCTIEDLWGRRHRIDVCGATTGDRAMLFVTDLTDILEARDEIARREAFYRVLVQVSTDGICVFTIGEDQVPSIALWNARMAEITGLSREQASAKEWLGSLSHGPSRERLLALLKLSYQQPLHDQQWQLTRNDETHRSCSIATVELPHARGKRRILLTVRDVTAFLKAEQERRQADAQVQHAQKLESLGMLAGGIAHDFNNILTAILGRSGLMASRLGSGHPAMSHLRDMEQASRRAASLCQQLLAYAGKGRTRIGPIDLRGMVEEMTRVLSVSVSENVTFCYDGLPNLPLIRGDANQIRQVVMNLITNAAEAIEGRKGTVTLRLSQRHVEDQLAIEGSAFLAEGTYVVLEVIDTGSGMDEATRLRMFEPFFTTKPKGRGLGMAAVLGIIHGHKGGLQVESLLGSGTTMRALFPIFTASEPELTPVLALPPLQPSGMVLVVDDEDSIRRTTRDMLIHLGFQTLEASSGAEAVATYRQSQATICAVILDLTMPGIDGYQALQMLRDEDSAVQVILASGYSRDEVAKTMGGSEIAAFLQKPFDIESLASALHLVLDRPAPGQAQAR